MAPEVRGADFLIVRAALLRLPQRERRRDDACGIGRHGCRYGSTSNRRPSLVVRARGVLGLMFLLAALIAPLSRPARAEATALPERFASWRDGDLANFALPDLADRSVALADQRGDAVLVHFFATWCEPCRDELAALDRLARRAPALAVLVISSGEPLPRLQRFFAAQPVTLTVLRDADRTLTKAWRIATLPTTIVFDARHIPRLVAEGDVAWDAVTPRDLIEALRKASGAPEAAPPSTTSHVAGG